MPRGHQKSLGKKPGQPIVNEKPLTDKSSTRQLATERQHVEESIAIGCASLRTDFHQENSETLREIKKELNKTNNSIDEAEEKNCRSRGENTWHGGSTVRVI